MPEVKEIVLPETAEMGVAIEGSEAWWPETKTDLVFRNKEDPFQLSGPSGKPFDQLKNKAPRS
jgi:hypothetical protein